METHSSEVSTVEGRRIGETIRTLREARGLTCDELAQKLRISTGHLRNIELGRRAATPVLVAKIADALAVKQIALVRDGYFDPRAAELLTAARKAERLLADLDKRADALANKVEGMRAEIADLSAKAKDVA